MSHSLEPARTLVVDDEPLARDALRRALEPLADVTVVDECPDGPTAVEYLLNTSIDLVLLDVQMPGMDGFEVCRQVGADRMPTVVFVTAHDQYALDAFRVRAVDYVLKPFDDERLLDSVRRAARRSRLERTDVLASRLADLLASIESADGSAASVPARRLTVRTKHGVRYVSVDDIEWLEAHRNYVRVHAGPETHTVRATLSEVTARLDPGQFLRVHRSRVVNLDHVEEVQRWYSGDYIAILRSGTQVRVSRRFRRDVLRLTS